MNPSVPCLRPELPNRSRKEGRPHKILDFTSDAMRIENLIHSVGQRATNYTSRRGIIARAPEETGYVEEQIKCPAKTAATCEPNCPAGWVKFNGRCFSYVSKSVDWVTAEAECVKLGGNLVSIHSTSEYQLVKALIRANDPAENPTWTGLHDCPKRFTWLWSDGTKFDYSRWNVNEPNNLNSECCVHLNWTGEKNWNDIPCELQYPFVCVKRLV
ncbi:lactose-binding lectin l-2-like [Salminus brasiliensis]|uniref:lactose-binding lectin l-2-like n=1 Tax=Salminus brasiliensis TaxID=930266 RepID=UPI003B834E4A